MNVATPLDDTSEKRIERLARRIVELRLEVPAVLFLQLHVPVAGILHHAALFGQPLLSPFFGVERISGMVDLFSERKNVDFLIDKIESLSQERSAA